MSSRTSACIRLMAGFLMFTGILRVDRLTDGGGGGGGGGDDGSDGVAMC